MSVPPRSDGPADAIPPPPETADRPPRIAPLALLVSLVALTFAPTLAFGLLNWDDNYHVVTNPLVVGHAPLAEHLRTPMLGYPAPLTVLTYRAEHALVGLRPALFHLTNVLLHLASTLLVYRIARRLGLHTGALAAALLFGLHPAVAEPVSWVSGRKDVLAAALALAALDAHLARGPADLRAPRTWTSPLLFALAALAKPSALFVPLFVAVYELQRNPFQRWPRRTLGAARAALPTALLAVPALLLAVAGQRRVGALRHGAGAFALAREAWYALGYHLGLVLGTQPPCPKHIPRAMPPAFEPAVDLLPLAFAAVGALALYVRPAARALPPRRALRTGLLLAALAYLPAAGVLPLVRYLADSYVYLPLAGLGLALGALIDEHVAPHLARLAPVVRTLLVAAPFVLFVPTTLAASSTWRSSVALWSRTLDRYPDSPQVCRGLGNSWNEAGHPARALEIYEACAARMGMRVFRKNIAITLLALGRTDEARAEFERCAIERPDDATVAEYLRTLRARP